MRERFHIENMRAAWDAGRLAKSEGKPIAGHNSWAYPKGKYYAWFKMGWYEQPFSDFADEYAIAKAKQLISEELARAGMVGLARQYDSEPGFMTVPIRALARYIANVE